LSEESSQKPEDSSGHPNEACDDLWNKSFVGKDDAGGCPLFLKELLNLRCIEWAELMHEPDARIERRKMNDPFLNSL
jgi:hypothetical protein